MKKILFIFLIIFGLSNETFSQDSLMNKWVFSWGVDWNIPIQKKYLTSENFYLENYPYTYINNKFMNTSVFSGNPICFSLLYNHSKIHNKKSFFNWEVCLTYYENVQKLKKIGFFEIEEGGIKESFSGDINYQYKSNYMEFSFIKQHNLKLVKNTFLINGIGGGINVLLNQREEISKNGVFTEGPNFPTTTTTYYNPFTSPDFIKIKFYFKTGVEFFKNGYSFSPFIIVPVSYFYTDNKEIFPISHEFSLSKTHLEIITGISISKLKYKTK